LWRELIMVIRASPLDWRTDVGARCCQVVSKSSAIADGVGLSGAPCLRSSLLSVTGFRLVAADAVGAYACQDNACGINGEAVCKLEERQIVTTETCGSGK